MKKVVIMFKLTDRELKEIKSVGFSGEIYSLVAKKGHYNETRDLLKRYQDIVLVTKDSDSCQCSKKGGFTYYRNAQADEIHQCNERDFEWAIVRRCIDSYSVQIMICPTVLKEEDGFKRIIPPNNSSESSGKADNT